MSPALRRRIRNHIFSSGVALCGGLGTAALGAMFLFLLAGAFPALRDQGLTQMLLSPVWEPSLGRFGLLAMFCATIAVSIGAVLLGLPVALFSAAFAQNLLPRWLRPAFVGLLELMSGLPSVLFGLVGLMTLLPALSRMFPAKMAASGGATLLAAILVLAAMMLPELTLALLGDLREAEKQVGPSSRALGATPMQTVFRAQLPAAGVKITTAGLGGIRRAAAEGIAVLLVSGNVVRFPSLFSGTRTLASGMILEMGYASGIHRSALFAAALLLLFVALLPGGSARDKK